MYDLETLIEKQFGEKGPTLETLYGDSSVLMVSGKPDQVKVVKQLVEFFEKKNASKPPVTRTLDLGELAGQDLVERLQAWGLIDETRGDSARVIGEAIAGT